MARKIPLSALLGFLASVQTSTIAVLQPKYVSRLGFLGTFALIYVLNFLCWIGYRVAIYPNYLSPLRGLPCPPGAHPLFGHAASVFSTPRGADYLTFTKTIPNDGLIRLKGIFNYDSLLVIGHKALAEVLVARPYDFPKAETSKELIRESLGEGLVFVDGLEHKRQRKYTLPSFGFRNIKDFTPTFWDMSLKLIKIIDAQILTQSSTEKANANQIVGTVDMDAWLPQAAMDVVGIAGLDRDFNSLEHSDDQIVNLFLELTEPTRALVTYLTAHIVLGSTLARIICFSTARRIKSITSTLRKLCIEHIQRKRKALEDPDHRHVDLLSSLIKPGIFDDDELTNQLLTFMSAGGETVSSAITWVLYLLSVHPEIQDRLRKEVQAAFPTGQSSVNVEGFDLPAVLESLPLLNAVVNETLRLYPTIPMIGRDCKVDTTIQGHFIPAGTRITVCPWATNKDPSVWGPDAEEFKPERWIDSVTGKANKNGGVSSNYAFLTFIHGPRSCVGQNFAKSEIRATTAALVGSYTWTLADPNEKVVVGGVLTPKPSKGLKLRLVKNKGW